MRQEEIRLREMRLAKMDGAFRTAMASGILSALLGALLTVVVYTLIRRNARTRERQQWLQSGQVGLAEAMMGDKSVAEVADGILAFLARHLGFQAGALFKGEGLYFDLVATLGVPAEANIPARFRVKQGLLGQVAAEGKPTIIRDVPDGYLTIGSAFGHGSPQHLVIVPARADGVVNAVMELGFLHPVDDNILELLEQTAAAIGIALRSARYRAQLQDVLEETQRQAEELQVQSEELRVSNEEAGGTGPGAEGIAGAARAAAGRAGADQQPARGTGPRSRNTARRPGTDHRRRAAEGPGSRAGQPVQVRLPGQHVARAAHAAQLPADPVEAAGRQSRRQPHRRTGQVRADHPVLRKRPADVDQRHPRPVEDRGRPDSDAAGERPAAATGRRYSEPFPTRRQRARTGFRDTPRRRLSRRHRDRSPAAGTGVEEPALQRLQVHPERRRHPGHLPRRGPIG